MASAVMLMGNGVQNDSDDRKLSQLRACWEMWFELSGPFAQNVFAAHTRDAVILLRPLRHMGLYSSSSCIAPFPSEC